MKLSVVIPAHNEEGSIDATVGAIGDRLQRAEIDYEILVVDDASADRTGQIARGLGAADARVRCLRSPYPTASASRFARAWSASTATPWRS